MNTADQNWVPVPDLKAILFPAEVARYKQGRCPFCGRIPGDFKDALSKREFEISGLCQQCQDDTFGPPENEPIVCECCGMQFCECDEECDHACM